MFLLLVPSQSSYAGAIPVSTQNVWYFWQSKGGGGVVVVADIVLDILPQLVPVNPP
jgi:hypothetical protein